MQPRSVPSEGSRVTLKVNILLIVALMGSVVGKADSMGGTLPTPEWVTRRGPGLPPASVARAIQPPREPAVATRTSDTLRLSNGLIAIDLHARNGSVRGLAAKGVTVACAKPFTPFVVTEERRAGHPATETWFHGPERLLTSDTLVGGVETQRVGNTQMAIYSASTDTGLLVRYWVVVRPGDPLTYWRMSVRNRVPRPASRVLVDRIAFPVLRGVCLGDPADDWWTWPRILGATVRADAFAPGRFWRGFYPDWLTMQWVDLYDLNQGGDTTRGGGMYVGCYDDYGYLKEMAIGRGEDGERELRFEFPGVFVVPGDEWATPWFGLTLHPGDWRAGANLYQRWAERAFGPIDVPEMVWDLPTANCWLQHHGKQTDIPRLFEVQQQDPIHASYFMKSLAISYPEGWSGEFGDALDYRESCDRLRALGGIAALFTFDRVPNHGRPHHADRAPRWLSMNRDGDFGAAFQDAFACPWPEDYRETRILDALRWARECGVGAIHFDTDLLPGSLCGPCYNPIHTHRPNETPRLFRLLYTDMVRRAREYVPHFFLRAEHCADFWYPAFASSTAHEFVVASETVASLAKTGDARLMPALFRVTLPRHAALQTPSMSADDFWVYGYGMGFGFHGGGPHQTFNPEVRDPEMPALVERYAETDWLWQAYYRWRVGFADPVVFGQPWGEVAVADWDGQKHSCTYPGPLVACTFSGNSREVTLGYWYPQSNTEDFAKRFLGERPPVPNRVTLRIPTRLPRVDAVFLHRPTEIKRLSFRRLGNGIELSVPKPDRFVVEVVGGVRAEWRVPAVISPGTTVNVSLVVANHGLTTVAASPHLTLPAGWAVTPESATGSQRRGATTQSPDLSPGNSCTFDFRLAVPAGIFPRNYPLKAALRLSDGTTTYAAAALKVREPLTVFYEFDTPTNSGYRNRRCLEPGRPGRLRVTVVNNVPQKTRIATEVAAPPDLGFRGAGQAEAELSPGPLSDFDPAGEPFRRWVKGEGAAPSNVHVHNFDLAPTAVPHEQQVTVTVRRDGKVALVLRARPRFLVADLNGPWRVKFIRNTRAITGGFWMRYDVNPDDLVPEAHDGQWARRVAPFTLSDEERHGLAWGIYRRRVDIPAEWQGTSIGLYVRHCGAPWGPGGTYNLVYVNGWPAGRLGTWGEVDLTPYVIYGGTNLIAIQQFSPNSLVDPYLFTRGALRPEAVRPVALRDEDEGLVYINLRARSSGNGIALPFVAGVPGEGFRRTDQAAQGESLFIYFAVADDYLFDTTEAADVVVEYLDSGTDTFALHYDSRAAGEHPLGGAFKAAEPARKTDSGEWRRHAFHLTDARFANRQHLGADFRLSCEGDGDDSFRRVEVWKGGMPKRRIDR